MSGSLASTVTPMMAAMASATSGPAATQEFGAALPATMASALALQPEILLIGTGRRLVFPAHSLYAELFRKGIGLEVMDTTAACRTYNILLSEGREVVAALFMI